MSYFHKAQNSLVLPACPDTKHASFCLGSGGHLSPENFISLLPFFSIFTKNFTVQYISWLCLFVFVLSIYLAELGLSCSTWDLYSSHSVFCCKVSVVVGPNRLSCPVACGILLPQPGIEPTSSASQDRFLTTGPPGKSWEFQLSLLRNRRESQGGLFASAVLHVSLTHNGQFARDAYVGVVCSALLPEWRESDQISLDSNCCIGPWPVLSPPACFHTHCLIMERVSPTLRLGDREAARFPPRQSPLWGCGACILATPPPDPAPGSGGCSYCAFISLLALSHSVFMTLYKGGFH